MNWEFQCLVKLSTVTAKLEAIDAFLFEAKANREMVFKVNLHNIWYGKTGRVPFPTTNLICLENILL